jgi:hypothetical protein
MAEISTSDKSNAVGANSRRGASGCDHDSSDLSEHRLWKQGGPSKARVTAAPLKSHQRFGIAIKGKRRHETLCRLGSGI